MIVHGYLSFFFSSLFITNNYYKKYISLSNQLSFKQVKETNNLVVFNQKQCNLIKNTYTKLYKNDHTLCFFLLSS